MTMAAGRPRRFQRCRLLGRCDSAASQTQAETCNCVTQGGSVHAISGGGSSLQGEDDSWAVGALSEIHSSVCSQAGRGRGR